MPFVRVRGAGKNDPPHEFDAAVSVVEANPDLYEVIDPEPVPAPRPVKYITPVVEKSGTPNNKKKGAENGS